MVCVKASGGPGLAERGLNCKAFCLALVGD